MTITAPEIGGVYSSYAPGHGALCFVHVCDGVATNTPVPDHIAVKLTPKGWRVWKFNGRLEAYRPYERIAANILRDHFGLYMYELKDEGHNFYFRNTDSDEWEPLRNLSRRASLRYWLTHEEFLRDATVYEAPPAPKTESP